MTDIFYIKALQDALVEEMERDGNVFMLGEDIGKYGGCFGVTRGLLDKFGPNQIIDTPMSESSPSNAFKADPMIIGVSSPGNS